MAWQPDLQQIAAVLGCTRSRAPLVHAITNQITMNDCANVVLSVGAGVVMAVFCARGGRGSRFG